MTPIIWPTWKQAAQPVDVSHPSLHSAHYCPPALYFDLARRSRRDAPSAPTLGIAFVIGRDSILPQRAKPDYPPATCDLRPWTCNCYLQPPAPTPTLPSTTSQHAAGTRVPRTTICTTKLHSTLHLDTSLSSSTLLHRRISADRSLRHRPASAVCPRLLPSRTLRLDRSRPRPHPEHRRRMHREPLPLRA